MYTKFRHIYSSLVAAFFILLFTYTAINKLIDQKRFEIVLSGSPLLHGVSAWLSWLIPVVELMVAMILVFPGYRRLGLQWSVVLMILFTIYIGYMLVATPHLPCSCGGVLQRWSWRTHFWFNVGALTAGLVAWRMEMNQRFIAIDRRSRKPV